MKQHRLSSLLKNGDFSGFKDFMPRFTGLGSNDSAMKTWIKAFSSSSEDHKVLPGYFREWFLLMVIEALYIISTQLPSLLTTSTESSEPTSWSYLQDLKHKFMWTGSGNTLLVGNGVVDVAPLAEAVMLCHDVLCSILDPVFVHAQIL